MALLTFGAGLQIDPQYGSRVLCQIQTFRNGGALEARQQTGLHAA